MRLPLSLLALGAALEGKYEYQIIDGNLDPDATAAVLAVLAEGDVALVGLTVMPGPQVGPAIALSKAVREAYPGVPIAWGGYFPTLYTEAALNARYVDFAVRGAGEETLLDLLDRLPADGGSHGEIAGLSWKDGDSVVHNAERPVRPPDDFPPLPYGRLGDAGPYLRPSFMGTRTAVHQAAIGCRYRCTFCGVVSMFNGLTRPSSADRLDRALADLRSLGANALQFYDHNFFDREETSIPALEVLARHRLPWWCYARADALASFSAATWELIRRSRLAMAYIGAEAASDEVLRRMKKGSRVGATFEAARHCREYGVIPEFSFVLGGPDDPEGEIERTFRMIRELKTLHPRCEVILYFYSPTPQRDPASARAGGPRLPVLATYGPGGPALPTTPEEWAQPRWVDYVCHRDAPWLTPKLRRRVRDFATVLACRFPTAQDYSTPAWGKAVLKGLARWRYASGIFGKPWELDLASRLVRPRKPQEESL
jgi:hypothetical protein